MDQVITVDPAPIAVEIINVLANHKVPINAADIIFDAVRTELSKQTVVQAVKPVTKG